MTDNPLVVATISPEEAHKTVKNIGVLMKEVSLRVFELGAQCTRMLETKGWVYNWDSLNAFIADLGFGRKTFFNYVRLNRLWQSKISRVINRPNCMDIMLTTPYYKILTVASHLEEAQSDDEIIQVLHNANKLSLSDLAIAYGKRAVEFRGRGKLYRIIDQNTQLYDITISSAKIHWGQADPQIYCREAAKLGWIVDFIVKIVNPEELELK